jgi:hypothetical protein
MPPVVHTFVILSHADSMTRTKTRTRARNSSNDRAQQCVLDLWRALLQHRVDVNGRPAILASTDRMTLLTVDTLRSAPPKRVFNDLHCTRQTVAYSVLDDKRAFVLKTKDGVRDVISSRGRTAAGLFAKVWALIASGRACVRELSSALGDKAARERLSDLLDLAALAFFDSATSYQACADAEEEVGVPEDARDPFYAGIHDIVKELRGYLRASVLPHPHIQVMCSELAREAQGDVLDKDLASVPPDDKMVACFRAE